MKLFNYLQVGLFIAFVHLKMSGMGEGASMTTFEMFCPLIVWAVVNILYQLYALLGWKHKIETWIINKYVAYVKRQAINKTFNKYVRKTAR